MDQKNKEANPNIILSPYLAILGLILMFFQVFFNLEILFYLGTLAAFSALIFGTYTLSKRSNNNYQAIVGIVISLLILIIAYIYLLYNTMFVVG